MKWPWMTTENNSPLSLGPNPRGRLKNLRDIDKWSSLSLCLSVRGMSVTRELRLYLYSRMGHIVLSVLCSWDDDIALSPVV